MKKPVLVNDKRKIKLEEVMSKDYIPFLSGRPKRDQTINNDDLINLNIALNSCKNLADFLKNV